MNKLTIQQLQNEKRCLHHHIASQSTRHYGKTMLANRYLLIYFGYVDAIQMCKLTDRIVTIEEAHQHINDFVSEMWEGFYEGISR